MKIIVRKLSENGSKATFCEKMNKRGLFNTGIKKIAQIYLEFLPDL